MTYIKRYWIVRARLYVDKLFDAQRLKMSIRIVISGYRSLASKEVIQEAIAKVRALEDDLYLEPYDFTEHEEKYNIEIQKVHDRGYL